MELNILKPSKAVHEAFKKPDLITAFMLVLLATIISIVGAILLGLQFNMVVTAISAFSSVASWIALGILFYIIGFVAEGNILKGKFTGILSALSLVWLVAAIMAVVGLILVATWPSGVVTSVNEMQRGQLTANQAFAKMVAIIDSSPQEQINEMATFAFNIVAFALMALILVILFFISKEISPKSTLKQAAITLVLIVAWSIFSGMASAILTL